MASGTPAGLLAIVAALSFGQTPAPVIAGDPAPSLTWTQIVSSAPTSAGPHSLTGEVTVLQFLPPVSQNSQTVEQWNKLVEQFADKPVNFVWIANEKEETLDAFLKTHPVRGWLILDPREESYQAYGIAGTSGVPIDARGIITGASGVLIDVQGKIAGFSFVTPRAEEIQAVLDGRAIAIQGEPSAAELRAILSGKAVRLDAEPFRAPAAPEKPNLPPSTDVHITLTQTEGTVSSTAPDHWMRRGFDLKSILAQIFSTTEACIDLPPELTNGKRYDFILVPPGEEDEATINAQVREGIEKYFHITIAPVLRPTDVYLMTAVKGKTPPPKLEGDGNGGAFAYSSTWQTTRDATPQAREQAMAMAELTGLTALSSTIDEVRGALEDGLHRPVIDETGLTGRYDFQIKGDPHTTDEFLAMLRDQLGILLTPTQRPVEMIVVRPIE